MKSNENKRVSFLVDDDEQKAIDDAQKDSPKDKVEKFKKPIIFILMIVIFFSCMYLIFKPSSDKKKAQDIGLNEAVPQATDAVLQSDKQKAYEQEMLEQKMHQNRDALTSLSDYWNEDSAIEKNLDARDENYESSNAPESKNQSGGNPALSSYRNAQSTLSSFYDNNDYETKELRRQIDELKEALAEKNVPPTTTVNDQLALMEKSYEMAAKYLPANMGQTVKPDTIAPANSDKRKEYFVPVIAEKRNAVSALYRVPSDIEFTEQKSENRNIAFFTPGSASVKAKAKNSIRACVQETQVISDESSVKLRLLEAARTPGVVIPVGTVVTANTKFNNGRLQLKINSIELDGNIVPVDITVYDLDGQQGLFVPYSPEMNALREIASNMSQTSGTSIMMNRSAGQQIAGDLSRGVVQGISGYFSKKMRTPKVTLKAGHQLLLVSKS